MSNALRSPSLGPIIGHTTADSCRVWIRGEEADDSRTVGIAALFYNGQFVLNSAQYFRLRREYDRTGIVDFTGLFPDSAYVVKAGSMSLDTPDPLDVLDDDTLFRSLPAPHEWLMQIEALDAKKSHASFVTFPAAAENSMSFMFGSCRYPGVLWMKKRADVIFKAIQDRVDRPDPGKKPRFFMMVGDQIYADTLPVAAGLAVANSTEEFQERYDAAFGAPNTRKLLQSIPTYMILDDHEIEDNWVQGRLRDSKKRALFNQAIHAYLSYQWLHGPRNYGKAIHYSFDAAGFPFFVLDGRTQRIRDDDEDWDLSDNHLLGRPGKGTGYKGQIDELCEWLIAHQQKNGNRPKFIVSASVFAPNDVSTAGTGSKYQRNKCKDDAWAAFPNTRDQLLRTVTDKRIQNVVFLSGDIHCSNVAEMAFFDQAGNQSDLRMFSVVSSAFYWPYPFADGDPLDYVHDSDAEGDNFDISNGLQMRYKASNFQQDDNFTQVDIDWLAGTIGVRTFGMKGQLLDVVDLKLAP